MARRFRKQRAVNKFHNVLGYMRKYTKFQRCACVKRAFEAITAQPPAKSYTWKFTRHKNTKNGHNKTERRSSLTA